MAKATRMASGLTRDLPLGSDAAAVRRRIEGMEKLLEGTFRIPGTNQKFGLDALLGFIPIGGDFIGAAMGLYMVMEARSLGMSKGAIFRMLSNVGVDWVLGLIPFVGIVPDLLFRSNSRNLRIIKKHLDKHHPSTATIDQR